MSNWFFWALLAAVFAALTTIFAKIGLEDVDPDLATLVRTGVIITVLAAFVYVTDKWRNPFELSPRTWVFLVLSGLATGASWVCYFRALKIGDASKVAPYANGTLGAAFAGDTMDFALIPGLLYAYKSAETDLAGYVGPAAVPAPETWFMLLAGLGLLGFVVRRRV